MLRKKASSSFFVFFVGMCVHVCVCCTLGDPPETVVQKLSPRASATTPNNFHANFDFAGDTTHVKVKMALFENGGGIGLTKRRYGT